MRRGFAMGLFVFLFAAISRPSPAEEPKPIWLVVGPSELTAPLEPLCEHRAAEGFDVRVAAPPVKAAIAAAGRPSYLLIVGDDAAPTNESFWRVGAPRRPLYRWRASQDRLYAADALFGDVDGDRVPDFPVGRIPARTPEQVARVVEKILARETRAPTEKDLRIVAWGCAPGYGKIADSMASGLLTGNLERYAPAWMDRYILGTSLPFSGWTPDQPAVFDRELGRGALLGAVLAHASESHVFVGRFDDERVVWDRARIREDFAKGPPAPPLILLACDAGDFTDEQPTIAQEALLLPGGPVAVIAATTESHPLTNYYTGQGLLRILSDRPARLGDAWLMAQRRALSIREVVVELVLSEAEGKLDDEIDIEKLRRDQLLMYALFGDPAGSLGQPDPLEVEIERRMEGGHAWRVSKPDGATALVVGLRPDPDPSTRPTDGIDEAGMRELLVEANAAGGFAEVARLGPDEPWSGVFEGRGELRLVVITPAGLRVFTKRLD